MEKTYLVVEAGVESTGDVLRNGEGDAIQVSLPVVGEYESHGEASANAGREEIVVVA